LEQHTERTITHRDALFEELETIRDQGYAFDRDEHLVGLRCVSAPTVNDEDRAIGAVIVSGPKDRLRDERFEEQFPKHVQAAANVIEINITFG
jgi:DNA-binding IclR family transcriptional regulator